MGIFNYFKKKTIQMGTVSKGITAPLKKIKVGTTLPDIIRWSQTFDIHQKDWLILGKGPSFDEIENFDLNTFYTCSLNHSVRELQVDLAHIIDIDVVETCKDVLELNAKYLVLPYYPHVKHSPTLRSIEDFVNEMPILESFKKQGRLLWYNLSSSKRQIDSSPMIVAKFFSAEAAVDILATCGVKTIRSLGVDGGKTYSDKYDDLKAKTLLANNHSSFDRQFEQIAKTIRTHDIFYAPLNKKAPIQIFVGTDSAQLLGVKVLEYSIKKHASMSVNLIPMCDIPMPIPKDRKNRTRTGFSFTRFLIPSLCEYKGRGIYLDADMLVFTDISKLWDLRMDNVDIFCAEQPTDKGRIRQYSVLLLNCQNLAWKIEDIVKGLDEGSYDYRQLMHQFCIVEPEKITPNIPYEWNSLEFYEAGKTCLIHYTDMPTQPWVSRKNQHGGIWYQYAKEAIEEGFIQIEEVYREIERGNVLPDLPQILGLPPHKDYKQFANSFIPPFKRFSKGILQTVLRKK